MKNPQNVGVFIYQRAANNR